MNTNLLQKQDLLNYYYNEGGAKCDSLDVYKGIQLLKFCAKKLVSFTGYRYRLHFLNEKIFK